MRAIAFVVLVASCGSPSDGGGPHEEQPILNSQGQRSSGFFADAGDLPACDESREGWIAYVAADESVQGCSSGAWQVLNIRGEKGDQGEKGESGESPGSIIELTASCKKSPDLDSSGDIQLYGLAARLTKFKSGDWFINCIFQFSDSSFTYNDTAGHSEIWAADSVGVKGGMITCGGYWAKIDVNLKDKTGTWAMLDDSGPQNVTCE